MLRLLVLLGLLGAPGPLPAQPIVETVPPPPPAERTLTLRDAIVLGVVEGITEFLPVSSTGHLIIANHTLGLTRDEPLRDAEGDLIWFSPPTATSPIGVPMTLKLAADAYIVIIQVGAILAVMLVLWRQVAGMLRGLVGQDAAGLRLLRNLLLAFFPVVIVGLSFNDLIDEHLFSIGAVIAALVSGAVLMLAAERWRRGNLRLASSKKGPADLRPREALLIGLMQCLALWPGMSRSMVTMVGGYFAGLGPARAAEFSFLVGLPVLGGAALYKSWQSGAAMLRVFGWEEVVLGAVVAAVSAAVAVKFLIGYLSRHGLEVFAIYRLVVAAVLAFVFLV